ncbi:helix-turn-helix domain-containing protein [Acinetobacter sp. ANC 5600]|uniref:helix-turn-helix domain-containing protein n=1 Tax=Acinetobacter sp. ANC 5600 TaxID=1960940 RepID=UPI0009920D80|nr:helix-turn-helix transcriptional regulator [Acinetobacter sp. ANC 5600]OOV79454.1 transcriptional regulator [Acinetobacter sp. ANC 5600]
MNNITLSIHSDEYVWLRKLFIQKRNELGLSQRALAERLGVIYSFVAKVETGDRKLDIFEFLRYCEALELDPKTTIQQLITLLHN